VDEHLYDRDYSDDESVSKSFDKQMNDKEFGQQSHFYKIFITYRFYDSLRTNITENELWPLYKADV
jgi:hypothetical protein